MLARHHLHGSVLPERMHEDPRREDLVGLFAEDTGVPFDDLVAVGLALWAIVEMRDAYPVPREALGLRLPPEQVEAALGVFSTVHELREEMPRREAEFHAQWSFDAFRLFPVIRMADDQLLVVSKDLLLQRLLAWLPIHDLRNGLNAKAPMEYEPARTPTNGSARFAKRMPWGVIGNLMPAVAGAAQGVPANGRTAGFASLPTI